jgi:hypothetical protein
MKQLGRFLRLERARKDTEPEVPSQPRRFATLEEVRAPGLPVSHPTAALERFAPEPPAPAPELELEAKDDAEPFLRCPRCGADSTRYATVCRQCEARLDTEEVHAFNVKLWADITHARARETEELRQREAFRQEGASQSREALAAEFAAREKARQQLELPAAWISRSWLRSNGGTTSPGLLLFLAVGIPVLLFAFRRGAAGIALLAGLVVLAVAAYRRLR